jgi:hypothetical protein
MRVPKQAKPVIRNTSMAKIESGICQSGLCETGCNLIPNDTAKKVCLAACPVAGGLTGMIPGIGGLISHLF